MYECCFVCMYMCVCMHVYMCVCMHVCMCVCMHVCMCVCMHVLTHAAGCHGEILFGPQDGIRGEQETHVGGGHEEGGLNQSHDLGGGRERR